jgi:hypothetical protein
MIANLICYACIVIVPSYIAVRMTHDAASFLAIEAVSQTIFVIVFFLRYRWHWVPKFHRGTI